MRLDSNRDTINREHIAQEFAAELSCEITERRCLGVMRDQVVSKTNRSIEDQIAKEAALKDQIRGTAKQFGKQLDSEKPIADIRAPKSSPGLKEFTAADLNKPLTLTMDPLR